MAVRPGGAAHHHLNPLRRQGPRERHPTRRYGPTIAQPGPRSKAVILAPSAAESLPRCFSKTLPALMIFGAIHLDLDLAPLP